MKVIIKKPGLNPEISEVENISEINKLIGNIDENGNGYNYAGTDIRMPIGNNIDMYVNENSLNNFDLDENLWAPGDNALFCGTIVFIGYIENEKSGNDVCSLNDEQINFCIEFINKQSA